MEALRIQGNTVAPNTGRVSVSSTPASTAAISSAYANGLPGGIYKLWATCTCYIKIGTATSLFPVTDVTTSTGDVIFAYNSDVYYVEGGQSIGIVTAGSDTGTFGFIKVV